MPDIINVNVLGLLTILVVLVGLATANPDRRFSVRPSPGVSPLPGTLLFNMIFKSMIARIPFVVVAIVLEVEVFELQYLTIKTELGRLLATWVLEPLA